MKEKLSCLFLFGFSAFCLFAVYEFLLSNYMPSSEHIKLQCA